MVYVLYRKLIRSMAENVLRIWVLLQTARERFKKL